MIAPPILKSPRLTNLSRAFETAKIESEIKTSPPSIAADTRCPTFFETVERPYLNEPSLFRALHVFSARSTGAPNNCTARSYSAAEEFLWLRQWRSRREACAPIRSEERRVGKECRSRCVRHQRR